jgi:hypothetical protein
MIVGIPHAATPEDHAGVRRKACRRVKAWRDHGEHDSLFTYAHIGGFAVPRSLLLRARETTTLFRRQVVLPLMRVDVRRDPSRS